MLLLIVHISVVALIALVFIKSKVWIPMLVTLILSFIYFRWMVSTSEPHGLLGVVFLIWPPIYTLLSGVLWFLFKRIRLMF
ncbi:hypothetical protein SAMN06297229_0040 [Pseudidiomarina planktonica]|uniref:Uncharacterized protein n=1 Tax=Pseudidiomarina planktonica TaxID=1323738 RepID=A0A1Y6E5F8_9GAMM|nr:hypothetical protein CWI77_08525 [Pseudidiomarina planktonica]SMQ57988.1 hypothetical protein SAMN06297229_0040 [Pseudidiomarina planktonica]